MRKGPSRRLFICSAAWTSWSIGSPLSRYACHESAQSCRSCYQQSNRRREGQVSAKHVDNPILIRGCLCSGGSPANLDGADEAAFMANFKLHVTGALHIHPNRD